MSAELTPQEQTLYEYLCYVKCARGRDIQLYCNKNGIQAMHYTLDSLIAKGYATHNPGKPYTTYCAR
jgi:hypothetical protein